MIRIIMMIELSENYRLTRIPAEWATSIVVSISKWKGKIMNYSCYKGIKLLEHGIKVIEKVLKKPCKIGTVTEMQFCTMPEKRTIDVVSFLRMMQEEYDKKCMHFDTVHKKLLEGALRKKVIPEFFIDK